MKNVQLPVFGMVLLLFVITSARICYTQNRYGFTLGLNASEITGTDFYGYRKAGLMGGGSMLMPLKNERWYLQVNLLYSQKGEQKTPRPDKGDFIRYTLSMHYAESQILFRLITKRIHILMGPGGGYLIKSREETDNLLNTGRPFRPYELIGTFGITYPLDDRFSADIRWTNSLLPVRDHLGGQNFRLNFGQFNTLISFTLNYHFGSVDKKMNSDEKNSQLNETKPQ